MSKVLVYIADGMEEVECLSVVDMLRRGGVETQMVSINGKTEVIGAHSIRVGADCLLADSDPDGADMLFLPGGMPGTLHLGESEAVKKALMLMNEAGKIVAAICAAPGVLGKHGLLEGKNACSYPEHEVNLRGANVSRAPVVVDGNIVTSRGLGTAMEFAFQLLELLESKEKADEIKEAIIYQELA